MSFIRNAFKYFNESLIIYAALAYLYIPFFIDVKKYKIYELIYSDNRTVIAIFALLALQSWYRPTKKKKRNE